MTERPMTARAYARSRNLAASTITRQIKSGVIPLRADGKIDPAAADSARASGLSKRRGGKRTKRSAAPEIAPGLHPDVTALLAVIRLQWPGLMQRLMQHFKCGSRARAVAVFALEELTEFTAIGLDSAGLDLPDLLPPAPVLKWPAAERRFLDRLKTAAPAWYESAAGARLSDDIIELTGAANGK